MADVGSLLLVLDDDFDFINIVRAVLCEEIYPVQRVILSRPFPDIFRLNSKIFKHHFR